MLSTNAHQGIEPAAMALAMTDKGQKDAVDRHIFVGRGWGN